MKYIIQPSEKPNHWVCTDVKNGIVCVFENRKYNETQNVSTLDYFPPAKFMQLAQLMGEMADWLCDNHYDKCL